MRLSCIYSFICYSLNQYLLRVKHMDPSWLLRLTCGNTVNMSNQVLCLWHTSTESLLTSMKLLVYMEFYTVFMN